MPRREDDGVDDGPKSPCVEGNDRSRRGSIQGADPEDMIHEEEYHDENGATTASEPTNQANEDYQEEGQDQEENEDIANESIPYQFFSSSYASEMFDTAIHPPNQDSD